jgi:hypothetical protein
MIKEAHRWFISQSNLIMVPSTTSTINGDVGFRSSIIPEFDNNYIDSPLHVLGYSEKTFNIYNNPGINYILFILGGTECNPVYSSNYSVNTGTTTINFINQSISEYNVSEYVNIVDKSSLELADDELEKKEIIYINYNQNYMIIDGIIPQGIPRLKIVNSTGGIYSILNYEDYQHVTNHKLKFGAEIYANT